MRTQVYAAPKEIQKPSIDLLWNDPEKHNEACDDYIKKLKEYVSTISDDKLSGEIVNFPVADGYARYMVVSLSPSRVIHMELDDAWHFQYISNLSGKDIEEKIEQNKKLNKLFS